MSTTKLSPAQLVEAVGQLTVLEAAEFVKLAEEKFGVKAAAMGVAAAAPAAGAVAGAAAEEKTDFAVFLVSAVRLGFRIYREEFRPKSAEGLRRVLVVGAGNPANNTATAQEIFVAYEEV